MKIQINTDHMIAGREDPAEQVKATLESTFGPLNLKPRHVARQTTDG